MTIRLTGLLLFAGLTIQTCLAGSDKAKTPLIPVSNRRTAPAFSLKDAAGKSVQLRDYRGKVVLLNFWATWCGGCKEEIPFFVDLQNRLGQKRFAIVGVADYGEKWPVLSAFVKDMAINYRMTLGDEVVFKEYSLESLPGSILIDSQGRIAAVYAGVVDEENLKTNLKSLLQKK